jgi:hypothetical protein
MDALCQQHFQSLKERNHVLASYYDRIASMPGRPAQPGQAVHTGQARHRPEEVGREA